MSAVPPLGPEDLPTLPLSTRRGGAALPDGTRLAEFDIRGVIGEGGFGIVYLAWDQSLQRQVAVKEYMPATLASRTAGALVTPHSERAAETFALGLRSFINEAQLLASFDHPSLLKVHRFWEDNGTAYMVMPCYRGVTLKRALAALAAPPEQGWLVQQLDQLLDALAVMHAARCFHRDIAPDNILLLDEGMPLLLDFGAARRVIGDATQALTAFLKPGYAPVEQYAEMPEMKQGPWTDLYALGSVVHVAITGHKPPESVARLLSDSYAPLARVAAGRYSPRFLHAIDHALAVRPQDRPQSVDQMRAELGLQPTRPRVSKSREIPTTPMPLDDAAPDEDTDATVPPSLPAMPLSTGRALPAAMPALAASASVRRITLPLPWLLGLAVAVAITIAATLLSWVLDGDASPEQVTGVPSDTSAPAQAAPAGAAREAGEPSREAGRSAAAAETGTSAKEQPPAAAPAGAAGVAAAAEVEPEPAAAPAAAPTVVRPRVPSPPRSNVPDPRCADIIARVSLGETLTVAERTLMQKECRK